MNARIALLSVLSSLALSACFDAPVEQKPAIARPDVWAQATDHLYGPAGPATLKGVSELSPLGMSMDDQGFTHVRVQQRVAGVPVFGGQALVHLGPDGQVSGVTDGLVDRISINPVPDLDEDDAVDLAVSRSFAGWEALSDAPQAELVALRQDGQDHLVWKVQLHHLVGDASESMPLLFIDAHSGETVMRYDNLQTSTCTGHSHYDGDVSFGCSEVDGLYYLEDSDSLVGTWSMNNTLYKKSSVTSATPDFGSDALTDSAVSAQWDAAQVLAWYSDTFGRDGIDGEGGPHSLSSHDLTFLPAKTSYGKDFDNAYWDGGSMTYGDGDGENYGPFTSLDLAGHEMTHGVVQYTAGLIYKGESGGLNESMADVFGAMIERSVHGESEDTWTMFEAFTTPDTAGDAARYLNDPAADGWSSDYWTPYTSARDVHYSSGIPNLAFYLVAEGGSHPRGKSSVVVSGIGADEAAEIWYLALTDYLTPRSDFADARVATRQAAVELYGASSAEVAAVEDAWSAVGVEARSRWIPGLAVAPRAP